MPTLSQTDAGKTSITMQVSGMDGSHSKTRYFYWQVYRNGSIVTESTSTSAAYATTHSKTITGLSSGVSNYAVKCGIYGDSAYTQCFVVLDAYNVYTQADHVNPSVSYLDVSQTSKGSKKIDCEWYASNVESGATWWLEVNPPGGSWQGITGAYGTAKNGWSSKDGVDLSSVWNGFGTYGIRVFVQNAAGYYDSDSTTVSMTSNDFAWTYPKVAGGKFNLTAAEWNGLWTAIEANLGRSYSHTKAVAGNTFTAAMYNQAVDAIGKGTKVSKGGTITAALMNALVTNVNKM
jgi:hypothetical protein